MTSPGRHQTWTSRPDPTARYRPSGLNDATRTVSLNEKWCNSAFCFLLMTRDLPVSSMATNSAPSGDTHIVRTFERSSYGRVEACDLTKSTCERASGRAGERVSIVSVTPTRPSSPVHAWRPICVEPTTTTYRRDPVSHGREQYISMHRTPATAVRRANQVLKTVVHP